MIRALKQPSQVAALKEEIAAKTQEITQLRHAARQLMAGLSEYAKVENWKQEGSLTDDGNEIDRYVWKEGAGPKLARYYLGLEEDGN